MIENVGFLDQTESLVTENDTNWNRANFAIAEETKFSNYGSALFTYNKFMGIFSSWLQIKPNVTLEADEKILKLPVIPQHANPFVIGFYGGNTKAFYVDKEGYLISNAETVFSSSGMQIYLLGAFGIEIGGVVNRLINLIHAFGKKVCLC